MTFPFHYAFKIKNLESTCQFYIDILVFREGHSSNHWKGFDFFAYQFPAHISDSIPKLNFHRQIDDIRVSIPHFGYLVSIENLNKIKKRLKECKISFIVPPQIQYPGKVGEQRTLSVMDYSQNLIDFKTLTRPEEIFVK